MKYSKEDEFKIVKYLRFRNYDPLTSLKTYMPLKPIAKFLNKSISYAKTLCHKIILECK